MTVDRTARHNGRPYVAARWQLTSCGEDHISGLQPTRSQGPGTSNVECQRKPQILTGACNPHGGGDWGSPVMSDVRCLAWSNPACFPHNISAWSNSGVTQLRHAMRLTELPRLLLVVAADQPRLFLLVE